MPYPIPGASLLSPDDYFEIEVLVKEITQNTYDKIADKTITARELAEAVEANQMFIEYLDELKDSLCLINLDE